MDKIQLYDPDLLHLEDGYRGLPKFSEILIYTDRLHPTLEQMQQIGFVGMMVQELRNEKGHYVIRAGKGKHGPCDFDGDRAMYTGGALAALDDDLHLLTWSNPIEICQKTKSVFGLSLYEGLISMGETLARDVELTAGSEKDGYDFESAVEDLYDKVKEKRITEAERRMMFYCGPFRMLVWHDGTIIRRGKWNNVPAEVDVQCRGRDLFTAGVPLEEKKPELLQNLYAAGGSAALLDIGHFSEQESTNQHPDSSVLDQVTSDFRKRLKKILEEEKKYFVLVGNDAFHEMGCCPSQEVSEANQLVRSGILDSFTEPVTTDACPVTMYAFRDEVRIEKERLQWTPNLALRHEIREKLNEKSTSSLYLTLKIVLMVFLALSVFLAARQCAENLNIGTESMITLEHLNPGEEFEAMLVLFHNKKRCYQCLEMESISLETLQSMQEESLSKLRIGFNSLVIEDPENLGLVEEFGIFAATLVLVNYSVETRPEARVLMKAPELYRDRAALKAYILSEIKKLNK